MSVAVTLKNMDNFNQKYAEQWNDGDESSYSFGSDSYGNVAPTIWDTKSQPTMALPPALNSNAVNLLLQGFKWD